jgi:para-aminobenzoate synthetase/4-amino-4-deoxychorismate lyase
VSSSEPPSAIVDFADAADTPPRRRVFRLPRAVLRADSLADVERVLVEADRASLAGGRVVGYVAYDAAPAFDPAMHTVSGCPLPLAWFAVFDAPAWSGPPPAPSCTSARDMVDVSHPLGLTDEHYAAHVDAIRRRIAAGELYQVNLTGPFLVHCDLDGEACYERMRAAQGGRYSAFLDLGGVQVLSASPELFFERIGHVVRSRPMKGTAARGAFPGADAAARDALRASEKERAENVMIVDVVRNDLGRVARVGSIRVPGLCEAERYPTVWQLTSTVEGEVDRGLPLVDLFRALFPPASITGAPKIRAMQVIRELEDAPRGVYCGAVGSIRPGGDAAFNVAIRTGWMRTGERVLHVGAGAGITIGSSPRAELAEVRSKVAAFTAPRFRPALFETIRVERGRAVRLARHLERLSGSAEYFGIPFDRGEAERAAATAFARSASDVGRGRLDLTAEGKLTASVRPFSDDVVCGPKLVRLAREPVDRTDVRLYHKTTDREVYERLADGVDEAFDVLLWNGDGEATELTRGTLVAEIDRVRWTPPVSCGLLPGTLRGELLDTGYVRERTIRVEELAQASRLWFVNSLRGWVPVTLAPASPDR